MENILFSNTKELNAHYSGKRLGRDINLIRTQLSKLVEASGRDHVGQMVRFGKPSQSKPRVGKVLLGSANVAKISS